MQSESDRKSEEMSRKILMIETSTDCCSAALAIDGKIVSSRVNDAPKVHASMLAPYVDEILKEAGCRMSDCDAVAVSEGPGSYTGLREFLPPKACASAPVFRLSVWTRSAFLPIRRKANMIS